MRPRRDSHSSLTSMTLTPPSRLSASNSSMPISGVFRRKNDKVISVATRSKPGRRAGSVSLETECPVDLVLVEAHDKASVDLDDRHARLARPADEVAGGDGVAAHVDLAKLDSPAR